ncbi:HD domain-containing protein [Gillisia sp. JM1]|uniref:HD domain-containing protein n=1 Tax=Gillisia sp. JM1 TaxID=1283286 RepID=UPI0004115E83|nr:HD domain-containing protein [Gillisia sp. JM1]
MDKFLPIYNKVISNLEHNLPPWLHYHCLEHTQRVLEKVIYIAKKENVGEHNLFLLKIAALYHDIGFIVDRENHEELSCIIASKELKEFELNADEIDQICEMMKATKIPQNPTSHLAAILADADLEYLGTDVFLEWSEKLYKELLYYQPDLSEDKWNEIQYNFISNHHYHTSYCKQNREPKKLKNLKLLKKKLEGIK